MSKALHIHSKDNTAVCTSEVKAGEEVEVIDSDGSRSFINAVSSIPFCNKIALIDIQEEKKFLNMAKLSAKRLRSFLKELW